MQQLNKSYKSPKPADFNAEGIFVFKDKNQSLLLSSKINGKRFRIVENETICEQDECGRISQIPFEQSLLVSVELSNDNTAVLGSECKSPILDKGVKATDLLYIFMSSQNDEYACYAYDMKYSFGGDIDEVKRFYSQCISTMKHAISICYMVDPLDETGKIEPKTQLYFGVITRNYKKQSLEQSIENLSRKPENAQTAIEKKIIAQSRQNNRELELLKDVFDGHIFFNGQNRHLDILVATAEPYELFFKDEKMIKTF